jgi:hypothetical protein
MFNFIPCPLYPRERTRYPLNRRLRKGTEPVWTVLRREKFLAVTGFGTQDCSVRG